MSEGCAAMHLSLTPRMACIRVQPSIASQPEPGSRLLQRVPRAREYAQRVRCSRLPPTVAALRSCGEAPESSASERPGAARRTSPCSATAVLDARAPIWRAPSRSSIFARSSRETSSTRSGLSTSIFIRSTRLVPPARKAAPAPEAIASSTLAARWKVKRRMSGPPRDAADRGDDVRVRAAPAEIAGHPLADLVVVPRLAFLEQGDRRKDLSRRAVAALERVLAQEGFLHRVQLSALDQPFDGGDAGALELRDQLQAGVHPLSVDDHGAGAALSHVASLLRTRETEVLPQRIQQDEPRLDLQPASLTVHDQRYLEKRGRS